MLVWLLCLCSVAMLATGRRQLSATVMVNGFGDLEGSAPGSNGMPVCQFMVERTRQFSNAVSFALAVLPMAPDSETLDSWTYKDPRGSSVPASQDSISRWRRGLQACFSHAVSQGMQQLHVVGHWDPLHPVLLKPTTWRNLMAIGPRQRAGAGYTFYDVMIGPVVEALNAVASPSVSVWFSVSGEMGLSNYLHPQDWKDVLHDARKQLRAKKWQDVKVATALNWQMFCGCVAAVSPVPGAFDPLIYNASFADAFESVKRYALPYAGKFKELLDANDYLALSAYGSGYPVKGLRWTDMKVPLQTLAYEMGFFGIPLQQYVAKKPVLYVEQGLGGVLKYGMLPAPDLATVVRYPFSGNWPVDGYSREVDPWQRGDFKAYRREFYKATLEFLSKDVVGGIFVWSVGSFDVFGVHPASTTGKGSFSDPDIISSVKRANGAGN